MSIAYIIFEKQPEAGRPAWSAASAHEFIRDRQADPEGGLGKLISLSEKAVDGYEAVIAKFDCATADTSPLEISLRLVPLSRTVTYAIEDEAALDDAASQADAALASEIQAWVSTEVADRWRTWARLALAKQAFGRLGGMKRFEIGSDGYYHVELKDKHPRSTTPMTGSFTFLQKLIPFLAFPALYIPLTYTTLSFPPIPAYFSYLLLSLLFALLIQSALKLAIAHTRPLPRAEAAFKKLKK